VFLPLINFLLFLLFGSLVLHKQLTTYVVGSMFFALALLIGLGSSIVGGTTQIAHLGV